MASSGSDRTPSTEPIRVAVVDDHANMRRGVVADLSARAELFRIVGDYPDPAEIDLEALGADVVVLDLKLSEQEERFAFGWIEPLAAVAKVLIYTSESRPYQLRRAMAAGASGLCLKSDDVLAEAIVSVYRSGHRYVSGELAHALLDDPSVMANLSAQQIRALHGVHDGLKHHEIADRMHLSVHTVRDHLDTAVRRYVEIGRQVDNSKQAAREAYRDGLLGDGTG